MPIGAIRPLQLHVDYIVGIGPRFVELEAIAIVGVDVKRGPHERRFQAHRIENWLEQGEEAASLFGPDVECDDIGYAHDKLPFMFCVAGRIILISGPRAGSVRPAPIGLLRLTVVRAIPNKREPAP